MCSPINELGLFPATWTRIRRGGHVEPEEVELVEVRLVLQPEELREAVLFVAVHEPGICIGVDGV